MNTFDILIALCALIISIVTLIITIRISNKNTAHTTNLTLLTLREQAITSLINETQEHWTKLASEEHFDIRDYLLLLRKYAVHVQNLTPYFSKEVIEDFIRTINQESNITLKRIEGYDAEQLKQFKAENAMWFESQATLFAIRYNSFLQSIRREMFNSINSK